MTFWTCQTRLPPKHPQTAAFSINVTHFVFTMAFHVPMMLWLIFAAGVCQGNRSRGYFVSTCCGGVFQLFARSAADLQTAKRQRSILQDARVCITCCGRESNNSICSSDQTFIYAKASIWNLDTSCLNEKCWITLYHVSFLMLQDHFSSTLQSIAKLKTLPIIE